MSSRFSLRVRGISLICALIPPLCLLSACGGGGGGAIGVASIPPPPVTPPPAPAATPLTTIQGYSIKGSLDVQNSWLSSPATRAGDYDTIGRLALSPGRGDPTSYRTVLPGEFVLSVDRVASESNFALKAPAGLLPQGLTSIGPTNMASSWEINPTIAYRYGNPYASFVQDLGQRLTAFDKASDGSETQLFSYDFTRGSTHTLTSSGSGMSLRGTLDYDIGYSYVALGEWTWGIVDLNGATLPGSESGDLLFVDGDRTPASGIPVSGTASYDARTLLGWVSVPFALTADFGQRTISTRIDQDYRYNPDGDIMDYPVAGIHVGGGAPFSNDGSFDIPLTGTANWNSGYAINTPATPPSQPVTGDMNGAFFGPNAEQVGGTFSINNVGGVPLFRDAFVGQHH
jgi:hypothetical protein